MVLYSGEFIKNNRDAGVRFMRAYLRGVRDYNDALRDGKLAGPTAGEIISILTASTEIKDRDTYANMNAFAVDPNGGVNTDTLKNDFKFFLERGLVTDKITVEQVIDRSFAEEPVRVLGVYKPK